MRVENVGKLLGACYEAKRAVELMPKLPEGMKASHIHVIDITNQLHEKNGSVRVSDIGTAMHVTNPSITRLVNELVELGAVEKVQSTEDKRVYTVSLTELGRRYLETYIATFHQELAERLPGIPEEDVDTVVRVIHEVYRAVSGQDN